MSLHCFDIYSLYGAPSSVYMKTEIAYKAVNHNASLLIFLLFDDLLIVSTLATRLPQTTEVIIYLLNVPPLIPLISVAIQMYVCPSALI